MGFNEEQIREIKRGGWSFRVKVVKGHRYITRRKNGKERSLGPYDEELWRLIEDTEELSHKPERELTRDVEVEMAIEQLLWCKELLL